MGYEKLFTPFRVGNMVVKNRIGMSPMGTNSAFTNGRKDAQEIDYFIERAKGGAGIIFMGCQMLNERLAQGSMEGYLDSYTVLPSLTSVVDGCHRYGAKIVCQISPGTGRNAFPDTLGNPPISSSDTPSVFDPNMKCHALTKDEITDIMEDFKFAAGIARDAGFDAVEIHAHAGYLIDQFMSPVWNKRTDEYGGSPEGCAHFPTEIVQAIKSVVGDTMPVIFRISLDHRFEGGRTIEDSVKLLKILEAAGVDAFDVDAGCYETLDYIFPPSYLGESCMSYVCQAAREAVDVPLFTAGTLGPDTALELIESGVVDFTNMGRALIADPELPNKLMAGHPEDVRPCLRCNEYCIGRIWNSHTKLGCAINAQAMEEVRFKLEKTDDPKDVVVIGGGPAGMEAARVAAICGHRVTLLEKADHLGGVMGDVCTAQFKQNIKKLARWYEVQLEKLGVDVAWAPRSPATRRFSRPVTASSSAAAPCRSCPPFPASTATTSSPCWTSTATPQRLGARRSWCAAAERPDWTARSSSRPRWARRSPWWRCCPSAARTSFSSTRSRSSTGSRRRASGS